MHATQRESLLTAPEVVTSKPAATRKVPSPTNAGWSRSLVDDIADELGSGPLGMGTSELALLLVSVGFTPPEITGALKRLRCVAPV